MIPKALRRAKPRHRIFFVALLLFVAGMFGAVGVTSAFFQAELDTKTATFAGGYLAVPTIGGVQPNTSTSSGYDGVFTLTNGTDQTTTNNEIQQIFGADQGATNNCTGAVYSTTVANSITSPTTLTTTTYTDSNRGSSLNGHWYCYEVVHGWPNTTAPVWTAAATTNVQLGLFPVSVAVTGNGNGKLGSGDSIVITYNQPVSTSIVSGSSGSCQFRVSNNNDVTYFGDTTCSSQSDSYTLGKLTGLTNGTGTNACSGTIAVSGNQVTYTATCTNSGSHGTAMANLGTFASSATVKSSATTDQASGCTTCTTTPTGSAW